MGNGLNEPIQFTRGDAERLRVIEKSHDELHKKHDAFMEVLHDNLRELQKQIDSNTRFRRVLTKVALWVITPGAGISGIIALILELTSRG